MLRPMAESRVNIPEWSVSELSAALKRNVIRLRCGIDAEADNHDQRKSGKRQHGQRDLIRQWAAMCACAHASLASFVERQSTKPALRSRYNIWASTGALTQGHNRPPIGR